MIALPIILIILCIAVIAANELFKFTDADAEIDEDAPGYRPDGDCFPVFGGVSHKLGDTE
jgi:hypothetical protein